jgi:hypothetical protein
MWSSVRPSIPSIANKVRERAELNKSFKYTDKQVTDAMETLKSGGLPPVGIAEVLSVHKAAVYHWHDVLRNPMNPKWMYERCACIARKVLDMPEPPPRKRALCHRPKLGKTKILSQVQPEQPKDFLGDFINGLTAQHIKYVEMEKNFERMKAVHDTLAQTVERQKRVIESQQKTIGTQNEQIELLVRRS